MFAKNKYVWMYAIIMLCYNITTSLGVATYYFKWVIGSMELMAVVSMTSIILLPLMLLFPLIMKKFGSMGNMIAMFCAIGIAGYLIVFFSGSNLVGVLAGGMLGSFATLPLAYYGVLFIMKCCTYNEMQGLPRMDGSANILSNFASKIGAAAGSAITGLLLGLAGYISGENVTAQPDSAIFMIRFVYALLPAICLVIIGLCAKSFSKLEKEAPEWEAKKKLEAEAQAAQK